MVTPDFVLLPRFSRSGMPCCGSPVQTVVVLRPFDQPREVLLVQRADNGR